MAHEMTDSIYGLEIWISNFFLLKIQIVCVRKRIIYKMAKQTKSNQHVNLQTYIISALKKQPTNSIKMFNRKTHKIKINQTLFLILY